MNIIFNHDGSIKNLNLNEIIVQGNNLVNEIQIAIEGRTPDDYVATAYFTLPDGTSNYLTGSADNFSIDQTPYSGYSINLTSAQTVMAGEVGMTIQCTDANSHVLCTYKVKLTINESGYIPEATTITMAQYASIIASLATFQQKFVTNNARYYPSYDDAEEDLGNLATNQLAIVGGDSTPLAFYFKNEDGELELITLDFGYFELAEAGDLTDEQAAQARKEICIIKYSGRYFFPQTNYGANRYFYAFPFWESPFHGSYAKIYNQYSIEIENLESNAPFATVHTDSTYADKVPTDGSSNLVSSNGVYDAIATAIANLKALIEGEISALDDLGIVVINDANDHKSGMLDTYQQSQAQKPYVIIKYINSDDIVTYFVSQFDYAEEIPNTKSFQSILGWVSSSEEGISGQYESSTIVIEDLYTEYPSWELDENARKVDEEPTEDSYNLVTSGGVYDAIASAKSTIEDEISSLTRTLIHKDDYSTLSTSFDAYGVAPKALPKASLDGFLGNSVVRNQQFNLQFFSTQSEQSGTGITATYGSDGTLTLNGTASETNYAVLENAPFVNPFIAGHKYLIIQQYSDNISHDVDTWFLGIRYGSSYQYFTTQIFTADSNCKGFAWRVKSGVTLNNAKCKMLLIDLTQWFGSNDLIPADLLSTPSLFLSKYAYGMDLSFNTGTLVDGTLTKLKANPFNIFDGQMELGDIDSITGAQISSTTRLVSINYIEVKPNTTYYVKCPVGSIRICEYGKGKLDEWNGYNTAFGLNANTTFTTGSNTYYIKFYTYQYGTTYHNDICINISNASMNGTYLPHDSAIETSLSIGTMRSAGSVRDTNELTKVGTYTFTGGENWVYSSAYHFWYVENLIPSNAISVNNGKTIVGNGIKVAIIGDGRTIRVYESDNPQISSSSTMSAVFPNGTKMNYELATPTARTTTFPEIIDIHSGGVIEAEFADLPITTKITYLEEE